MRDAVIVEAVRTPTGKRNGGLAGIHSADLSAHVLRSLVERTGIDPAVVDDVIWGCVMQIGEQTFDIARTSVLSAGWPESVPGTTVDRQCGSSQQAVHFAAAGVISGQGTLGVGASGAIFGLFGAYYIVVRRLGGETRSILILLGVNLVITFAVPIIDKPAHLGGLLVGALVATALAYAPRGERRNALQAGACVAVGVVILLGVVLRTAALS